MASKSQKIMVQPITMVFDLLQKRTPVRIWLYDHVDVHFEGQIIGFDEFMNLVLDQTVEVNKAKKSRHELGRIMLKGDNITLIQRAPARA